MSNSRRKPKPFIKAFRRISSEILRKISLLLDSLKDWTLRRLRANGRNRDRATAGFVLPTAVMVILVVTLLTTAIVIRSTDRAKNASNYRVNQVTLNASLPAIERAKKKIDKLFTDPNLPQGAPSDLSFYSVLKSTQYNLSDEIRVQLAVDIPNGTPQNNGLPNDKVSTTAWRYPVDTDNNGKFDSFTLYGIYFRTPPKDAKGFSRERSPLEARTPPQDNVKLTANCAAAGTSASLVGADGWFRVSGNLKKSFYVYTVTVPITNKDQADLGANNDKYENYSGNRGFTGLEYQQDRVKIPFGNNAVVYEDDLNLYSGAPLKLNGRVLTSSNLVISANSNSENLRIYQVSSPNSCFYEEENGKILVGGNVGFGIIGTTGNLKPTNIHLFPGKGNKPTVNTNYISQKSESSVNDDADVLAYNNKAYEDRIALLVKAALEKNANSSSDPESVRNNTTRFVTEDKMTESEAREKALNQWFRDLTRRVPYAEVPFGVEENLSTADAIDGEGTDWLRPRNKNWIFPTELIDNDAKKSRKTATTTKLNLLPEQLPALDPKTRINEKEIGDRILVGNGLPASFYNEKTKNFETNRGEFTNEAGQQSIEATKWKGSDAIRYRKSQVSQGVDIGQTDRNGSWEKDSATYPDNSLDDKGGLRIVTGAGVYLPAKPNDMNSASKIVWPDWMPAIPNAAKPGDIDISPTAIPWLTADTLKDRDPAGSKNRPFLRMRASAVYHYTYRNGEEPIACVSSYYDPTDSNTAQNRADANVSGGLAYFPISASDTVNKYNVDGTADGQSNNGITYGVGRTSSGTGQNDADLLQQAELVYPNGRLVNPLLRQALSKSHGDRTRSEKTAIDSTLCALNILGLAGSTITPNESTPIGRLPHGAIQEIAFLDAREVKQLEYDRGTENKPSENSYDDTSYSFQPTDKSQTKFINEKTVNNNSSKRSEYDRPIELRQPMEIRATVLDLDVLRKQTVGQVFGNVDEYLIPNSGIVYVSRDDALPDASNKQALPWGSGSAPAADQTSLELAKHELDTSEPGKPRPKDRLSATDFWLDPTRRSSGVLLINGRRIARAPDNKFRAEEKGLILASNLPVYIKAQSAAGDSVTNTPGFNVHDREEFSDIKLQSDPSWSQFYDRTTLDTSFACRKDDPRLNCNPGDQWRSVSILADTISLLSDSFRFGFRNEGDFDLRNNQVDNGFRNIKVPRTTDDLTKFVVEAKNSTPAIDSIEEKRLDNGFFDNNFVTNGLSSEMTVAGISDKYKDKNYAEKDSNPRLYSSYFNNFVTPIQRRNKFSEYLMETCTKLLISECDSGKDWSVDGTIKASNKIGDGTINTKLSSTYKAGTTARPPQPDYQKYARRVAFLRQTPDITGIKVNGVAVSPLPSEGSLILDNTKAPIPLGIDSNTIKCYTSKDNVELTTAAGGTITCDAGSPPQTSTDNTLLFRTVDGDDRYKFPDNEIYKSDKKLYFADDLNRKVRAGQTKDLNSNGTIEPEEDATKAQPLLVPILQIHVTEKTDDSTMIGAINRGNQYQNHWLPWANSTDSIAPSFNAILIAGDSPGRTQEFNGALANFPHFTENWARDRQVSGSTVSYRARIEGSFIQLKRSAYATGPYWHLLDPVANVNGTFTTTIAAANATNDFLFRYPQFYKANGQRNQTYEAPSRQWGFDVGLLSQLPDALAKKLNRNSSEAPSEYYRETSRDDAWTKTLLCATQFTNAGDPRGNTRPAVNNDQRPQNCVSP
ncbi:hormogonium polysaccharide biosynthesis protein HpsA [Oscillatoria sp. FACHB-1406]|uniref:hormogonium polysaccharide biosynthesis protein HpsA n=1 Tax=Oscillatoria sp. FACHB-1406 TaxID=2692846 RepID=UPI0016862A75|nr:hormogonium polysaccharide biosynthesis protein HpsA [Oscillatoria sp. FACHB-1406]MBD2577104.1 hypothetical protein [Oscillatoria sp. FACHB-1406]